MTEQHPSTPTGINVINVCFFLGSLQEKVATIVHTAVCLESETYRLEIIGG